ncbi:MAG: hypothetical protein RL161_616, partial [Bacteroidota bacterium]
GLDKGKLLSLICDRTGIKGKDIGKIELKGAYSFFEVDKQSTENVRKHLHGFEFRGRIVRIEVTEKQGSGSERGSERGSGAGRSDRKKRKFSEGDFGKKFQKPKKNDDWFASKTKGW